MLFQSSRDGCAQSAEWKPEIVQYVECWKYSTETNVTPSTFRHGTLNPPEIEDWLQYRGRFSIPTPRPGAGNAEGGVRLLICNRTAFHGLSLGLSMESFQAVESMFKLHPATLHAITVAGGMFSKHLEYTSPDHSTMSRISIILKAPQKHQIANYMLSLTHDLASHWTTALLVGESVVDPDPGSVPDAIFTTIYKMLRESTSLWSSPLLLPCIIMTDHLFRMQRFCEGPLTEKVMTIEDRLGMTRVGRRREHGVDSYNAVAERFRQGEPVERSHAMDLTIKINSQLTTVLFSKRSPQWNQDASKFLITILRDIPRQLDDYRIGELLEHNLAIAKSVDVHVSGLQSRLDLQLNVLYSFVAQTDNRLSARLAATSGRDSTSMKILAFITTLFLPGTFIATLFSMDMFNWQYNGDDGGPKSGNGVVSSRFWIFWAVDIPLTFLTLSGWALWWHFEKNRYDIDIAETLKSAECLDEPSWWQRMTMKRESPRSTGLQREG